MEEKVRDSDSQTRLGLNGSLKLTKIHYVLDADGLPQITHLLYTLRGPTQTQKHTGGLESDFMGCMSDGR